MSYLISTIIGFCKTATFNYIFVGLPTQLDIAASNTQVPHSAHVTLVRTCPEPFGTIERLNTLHLAFSHKS